MTRIQALRDRLHAAGLDAMAITAPDHIRYLCGASVGRAVLVVDAHDAYLLTSFVDTLDARQRARDVQVLQYTAFAGETTGQLAALPDGIHYRVVGFESEILSVAQYESFRAQLPDVEFREAPGMVETLRAVKDAKELELLRRACAIADAAMERAVGVLREGITEREMALDIEAFMRASNADSIAFNLIQFGVRSALPHGEPLATPLEAGQFVLIDIGPRIDLYNADLTRTVVFGQASEAQRQVYDAVLRAQLASLEAVRPGATGEEVDAVSRKIIETAGYGEYYGHSLGHAIAGGPMLAPGHKETLQPCNVVTVEPGIYIPDLGGVRIEDTVLVTNDGCERLTQYPKELREIPARA